jgi:hypothetical protein
MGPAISADHGRAASSRAAVEQIATLLDGRIRMSAPIRSPGADIGDDPGVPSPEFDDSLSAAPSSSLDLLIV